MRRKRLKALALLGALFSSFVFAEKAPITGIGAFQIPSWFKVSFLDLQEDGREAASQGKRLAIFFHQNGCPYCAELINNNFSQKHIADYTQKHFFFLDIDMWGDRDVTDFSGRRFREKTYAASQKVWFTPTLLFFDEHGKIVLRVNGYYPPHRLLAALQYVAGRYESRMPFSEYYAKLSPPPASGKLHAEPFFQGPPYNFAQPRSAKPLLVLFEQKDCTGCDELHQSIFQQPATRALLARFDVFRLDRWGATPLVTPAGKRATERSWADELNIGYVPAAVFFDEGEEVMRIEAMLKAFHVQSVMDYVASRAYKREPSFQRFISARGERLREQGVAIDLWK